MLKTNTMLELARRIKPVISFKRGVEDASELYFVRESDIIWHNYAPYPVESAKNLKEVGIIPVVHIPTVERLSPPTTLEVLRQIPEKIRHDVVAFKTLQCYTRVPDFKNKKIAYLFNVALYSGKLPRKIAKQPVIINGKVFSGGPVSLMLARARTRDGNTIICIRSDIL